MIHYEFYSSSGRCGAWEPHPEFIMRLWSVPLRRAAVKNGHSMEMT